jgi:hypothetical protein
VKSVFQALVVALLSTQLPDMIKTRRRKRVPGRAAS